MYFILFETYNAYDFYIYFVRYRFLYLDNFKLKHKIVDIY